MGRDKGTLRDQRERGRLWAEAEGPSIVPSRRPRGHVRGGRVQAEHVQRAGFPEAAGRGWRADLKALEGIGLCTMSTPLDCLLAQESVVEKSDYPALVLGGPRRDPGDMLAVRDFQICFGCRAAA